MSGSAKLMSIDAVRQLSAAVRRFVEEANQALAALDFELHRAAQYFQLDRREYWTHEVRKGWDTVAEARINLQRRQMMMSTGDRRPQCDEEQKTLERAQRRLRLAEEKTEAVRHWVRLLDREMIEYRGSAGPLANWLAADAPKLLALLERMSLALEDYVAVKGRPSGPVSGPPAGGAGSAGSSSPPPTEPAP